MGDRRSFTLLASIGIGSFSIDLARASTLKSIGRGTFFATWCCTWTVLVPAGSALCTPFGGGIKLKVFVVVCGPATFKGRANRVEVWSSGLDDTGGGTELLFEARELALWVLLVIEACTRKRRGGLAAEGVNPNKLVEGNSAAMVLDRANAAF